MKKLMIAFAAVAMAAVAQAGAVNWSATKIYVGDDTAAQATTYACYLFTENGYSSSNLASELAEANFANLTKAESSTTAASVLSQEYEYNTSLPVSASAYSAYMVVFDAASAADAKRFYISENADLIVSGSADGVSFEKLGNKSAAAWTDVAPEPTSGLLLLVGMAGLALKRKRA